METLNRSPSDRMANDAIEDLGRNLGFSATHEVGHNLGLVSSDELRGSRGPASAGEIDVTERDHPDLLDAVTAASRIPTRTFMVSGSDPLRLVNRSLTRTETQIVPPGPGDPCRLSPVRVPPDFGDFNRDYVSRVTPGP